MHAVHSEAMPNANVASQMLGKRRVDVSRWGLWLLGVFAVVLVLVCWASDYVELTLWWSSRTLTISNGLLTYGFTDGYRYENVFIDEPDLWVESSWLTLQPTRLPFEWWFESRDGVTGFAVGVPLWLFPVVAVIAWALLWRWRRNTIHQGVCRKCAYDLTGLGHNAKCPECGHTSPGVARRSGTSSTIASG